MIAALQNNKRNRTIPAGRSHTRRRRVWLSARLSLCKIARMPVDFTPRASQNWHRDECVLTKRIRPNRCRRRRPVSIARTSSYLSMSVGRPASKKTNAVTPLACTWGTHARVAELILATSYRRVYSGSREVAAGCGLGCLKERVIPVLVNQ